MNRQQMIQRVLIQEAAATQLRANAAKLREQLHADAVAEFDEQGTAPTWRLPDIGTVTLPVTTETVYVTDEAALVRWLEVNVPSEVETVKRVRPGYLPVLLSTVRHDDGDAVDVEGTVIPGLAVRPGGMPKSLSFRPTAAAREVLAAGANALVADLEQRIGQPVVLAEPEMPS